MNDERNQELPDALAELLDGARLEERAEHVFELLTVSEAGWPHIALLSVGEVLVTSPRRLMLGLWPTSTTTANLRQSGRAVLQLYHAGAAYRARLECRPRAEQAAQAARLAIFDCRITQLSRDAVGYARLTSGPRIELPDADRVVARWRAQVHTLRRAAEDAA